MRTVRDIVKQLCFEKGISVQKLENDLGFSNGTVSKWSKSIPNSKRVQALADYFQVSTDRILGNEEQSDKTNQLVLDADVLAEAMQKAFAAEPNISRIAFVTESGKVGKWYDLANETEKSIVWNILCKYGDDENFKQ